MMIRTWHGWVESINTKDKRQRNRLHKLPPWVPQTSRTSYNWIFWDPTGDLQRKFNRDKENFLIRCLPNWIRSSPFGSVEPDVNQSDDIETSQLSTAGGSDERSPSGDQFSLAHLGRRWHRRWRRARTWATSSDTCVGDSECDLERQHVDDTARSCEVADDSTTTVRLRKQTKYADSYELDSEDIERAANTLLIKPTAVGNLLRLFRSPSARSIDIEPRFSAEHPEHREPNNPPPHQLPNNQYSNVYPIDYDGHQHASTISYKCYATPHHRPPRRLSTWTYGLDGSHSTSTPRRKFGADNYTRPRAASDFIMHIDTHAVDRDPLQGPEISIPRKLKRSSTGDGTRDAECMTVIGPSHREGWRLSGDWEREVWDAKGYEMGLPSDWGSDGTWSREGSWRG